MHIGTVPLGANMACKHVKKEDKLERVNDEKDGGQVENKVRPITENGQRDLFQLVMV